MANDKNESGNTKFIQKLKAIGVRQQMNGNNASKLIIDSVLSAMITSKNNKNEKRKQQKEKEEAKGKEIKMKVTVGKAFKKNTGKKKQASSIKYAEKKNVNQGGEKAKRRRKMKRE